MDLSVSGGDQVGEVLSGEPVSHGRGAWKMAAACALLETKTQERRQSVGDVIRAAAAVANYGKMASADDMYSLLRRKSSAAVFGKEERNTSPLQHRAGAGPAIHSYTAHYTSMSSKGAGSFGSSNPVSPRQRRTILAVDGNGTLRLPSLPQEATHPGSQSAPNTPRHHRPPSSPPLHRPLMSPPLHRPSMRPASLRPSMSPTSRHGVRFPADAVPTSQARSSSPNSASYSSGMPPSPPKAVVPSPRRSQHDRQLGAVYLCAVYKEPPPARPASVWPGWSAGTLSPHAPSPCPSPYPCPGVPEGKAQTPAHSREGAKAKQRRLSMAYPQQQGPWVPVPETPRTALAL